ncbi:hypothetical protein N9H22_04685 [Opitutales bacterium]|nr:hypothetical protein [Opitutales bacterium]
METDTEANGVVTVAGVEAGAVGRTQVRAGKVPGAAPTDTVGARSRPSGINHRVAAGIGRLVPVGGPFPHISMHIKKAPWVGRILPHITGLLKIVSVIRTAVPVVISPSRIYVISPRIHCGRTGPTRIFPL